MLRFLRHGPLAFWVSALLLAALSLIVLGAGGPRSTVDESQQAASALGWELLDAYGSTVGTEGSALVSGLTELSRVADRCEEDSHCVAIAREARDLARAITDGADSNTVFERRLRIGRLVNTYTIHNHPGVNR